MVDRETGAALPGRPYPPATPLAAAFAGNALAGLWRWVTKTVGAAAPAAVTVCCCGSSGGECARLLADDGGDKLPAGQFWRDWEEMALFGPITTSGPRTALVGTTGGPSGMLRKTACLAFA